MLDSGGINMEALLQPPLPQPPADDAGLTEDEKMALMLGSTDFFADGLLDSFSVGPDGPKAAALLSGAGTAAAVLAAPGAGAHAGLAAAAVSASLLCVQSSSQVPGAMQRAGPMEPGTYAFGGPGSPALVRTSVAAAPLGGRTQSSSSDAGGAASAALTAATRLGSIDPLDRLLLDWELGRDQQAAAAATTGGPGAAAGGAGATHEHAPWWQSTSAPPALSLQPQQGRPGQGAGRPLRQLTPAEVVALAAPGGLGARAPATEELGQDALGWDWGPAAKTHSISMPTLPGFGTGPSAPVASYGLAGCSYPDGPASMFGPAPGSPQPASVQRASFTTLRFPLAEREALLPEGVASDRPGPLPATAAGLGGAACRADDQLSPFQTAAATTVLGAVQLGGAGGQPVPAGQQSVNLPILAFPYMKEGRLGQTEHPGLQGSLVGPAGAGGLRAVSEPLWPPRVRGSFAGGVGAAAEPFVDFIATGGADSPLISEAPDARPRAAAGELSAPLPRKLPAAQAQPVRQPMGLQRLQPFGRLAGPLTGVGGGPAVALPTMVAAAASASVEADLRGMRASKRGGWETFGAMGPCDDGDDASQPRGATGAGLQAASVGFPAGAQLAPFGLSPPSQGPLVHRCGSNGQPGGGAASGSDGGPHHGATGTIEAGPTATADDVRPGPGPGPGRNRGKTAAGARAAARAAVSWPDGPTAAFSTAAAVAAGSGEAQGPGAGARVGPARRGAAMVSRHVLKQHYHRPIKAVAKELGLSLSCFKKECRRLGVPRWPARKLGCLARMRDTLMRDASAPAESKKEMLDLMQQNLNEIIDNPDAPMYNQWDRVRHEQYKVRSGCRRSGGAAIAGRRKPAARLRRADSDNDDDDDDDEADVNDSADSEEAGSDEE
ncbi:hypothetical protein GPECTOR_297g803 [Gonium pectorale]|uniref:RWP-RK domain-containing protein n=1 Tax=Gonium pectorale TaxID=33097 RepID=A0A150FVW5_GONPE|nr:hypothetical protein GPECTOR_297g803 [Gonium pectorale]|eukprot:KXZ41746.1 hypothetical protein GPECTOR_297g803 [Gonium pectorale]